MQITNKHNLPQAVFDALKGRDFDYSSYPRNIYWLTRLIGSAKCSELERRHWAELEEDVSERVFRILGTGAHSVIEQYQSGDRLSEEKVYVDMEEMKVYTLGAGEQITKQDWYTEDKAFLSMRLDCYDANDKAVEDYKVSSVWSVVIEGKPKPEWVVQNNIAAWVLRKMGFETKKARNVLFLRDWQKSKAGTDYRYPKIPVHVFDNPLFPDEKIQDYLQKRIKEHVAAESRSDDGIPICTPEERWSKPDKYAVMKPGRKTAVKLFDDKAAAELMAKEGKNKEYVEYRPGQDVKCESYCSVNQFCNFYKSKYGG